MSLGVIRSPTGAPIFTIYRFKACSTSASSVTMNFASTTKRIREESSAVTRISGVDAMNICYSHVELMYRCPNRTLQHFTELSSYLLRLQHPGSDSGSAHRSTNPWGQPYL